MLRQLKIPIFRYMVINYANKLVEGTELEAKLKHKEVRRYWYYHWLSRCKRLHTSNIRPLEMTRAQWATPENALKHYEVLRDLLLELGIAAKVPEFNPDVPYAEELKILKPGRIFSMDETRLTNDTTDSNKSKANRSILGVGRRRRHVAGEQGRR